MTNHAPIPDVFNNYIAMIIIIILHHLQRINVHDMLVYWDRVMNQSMELYWYHYSMHLVAAIDGCCSMECYMEACMAGQEPTVHAQDLSIYGVYGLRKLTHLVPRGKHYRLTCTPCRAIQQ